MSKKIGIWKAGCISALFGIAIAGASSNAQTHRVELSCHRTANKDIPENTLESLRFAALMGCDIIEVDIRKTLDGVLVLQHDGFLERLSDGSGEVEKTNFQELELLDAGSWMGAQFAGMRIPRFVDALRIAKSQNVQLYLDIKDKGIGPDILQALRDEGMLSHVQFGGERDDILHLLPEAEHADTIWVQPDVSAAEITKIHASGKRVIVNFSESGHDMDVALMREAVANGADGLNTDYPRLGAAAAGRPVEERIATMVHQVDTNSDPSERARIILALAEYRGFALELDLMRWLQDANEDVSHAAALAIILGRFHVSADDVIHLAKSASPAARNSAAWLLGMMHSPSETLLPFLNDADPAVQEQALMAITRTKGSISRKVLADLLESSVPATRGAAALALAAEYPQSASLPISSRLEKDVQTMSATYKAWDVHGRPPLTDSEKAEIVRFYRCQMQEVLALSHLHDDTATRSLEQQVFRPGKDFSAMNGVLSTFELWSRTKDNLAPFTSSLHSNDPVIADHAESILMHGGKDVAQAIEPLVHDADPMVRHRAIVILATIRDQNLVQ